MKYDFTSIMDRRGKDALAIDGIGENKVWGNEPDAPKEGFDFIPMWVADMNFPTCPSVTETIMERLRHPAFGYFRPSEEYYNSIIRWQEEHFGVTGLRKEHIGYENGVHGCVTSAVNVLSEPGEKILMHSPFYLGFTSDIEGLGRRSVYSPLKKDEEGIWRMDYEDMDRKLKENHIHLAIFCSPHNPCGRVWERWELEKAMEVYEANNCYVISDEIWADLTFSGHRHIPTQSINEWAREHVIAVYAPSKTFNLAGMIGSYHVIYGSYLRDRITRYGDATHYNEMNVLSMHALIGAYKPEGSEWLRELRTVLEENARYAVTFTKEHFHGVDVSMPQGTYMIFLDCTEYCQKTGMTIEELLKAGWDVGVGWQDGRPFGGACHIRMNLASPMSRIEEAFARFEKYVFNN
ncbi:MAG: aminotransferase class I/II-fold pyridoxal phosphate-dependent enzyme [Clostridiales bacterium]|uniref:cysteine-S-conjugate beta-lyase n=1 Tax=Candidatus Anaerobutyricum stercoripullorum TaxID=2838456 RepID=A0A9D2BDQ3_9FIRM|nr:aminotransferase class I/II-fold pyridoxal phosphate-dependent enzyme [Clostridiales bacterium]HIX71727.1 aminotransferase class I/II-fold pyridoxal phosphate-dependent enzyme [Candidatus Anaerobutyricum stercoripullorum]